MADGDIVHEVNKAIEEAMALIVGGCALASEPLLRLKITTEIVVAVEARTHPARELRYTHEYRADGFGTIDGRVVDPRRDRR